LELGGQIKFQMKNLKFLPAVLFFSLVLSGCKKECSEWREGNDCDRMTSKFIGTYYGTADCGSGSPLDVVVTISEANTPENQLYITIGAVTYYGLLKNSKLIDFPNQTIPVGQSHGEGVINENGKDLTLYLNTANNGVDFWCSFNVRK
jgi:hypothetical protein